MIKIGITGKMNSGKNLLANELELILDPGRTWFCKTMAFADPIKEIAQLMFPWADRHGWYGASKFRNDAIPNAFKGTQPLTYRQVLIDVGSLARSYDEDHWVKVFDDRLDNVRSNWQAAKIYHMAPSFNTLVIVSDIRFRNEFDYLRKEGFYLIKLQRNVASTSTHPTEINQDQIHISEFDQVVDNNGTIDELKAKVPDIRDQILAHQK